MSLIPERQPCRALQLGAGLFLKDVKLQGDAAAIRSALRLAIADDGKILGATLSGGTFRAKPEYLSYGEEPELTVLKGWEALLTGTLTDCSPEGLAALLGPAETVTSGGVTVVKARTELREEDTAHSLCWLGNTTAGLLVIELTEALSLDGLSFTFGQERCGTAPFRFRAFGDGESEEAPFRLIFLEEDGDEAE